MSHAARTGLACRNCGAQAPLKFCPECGQETTLHPPTLGEFLHEFVGHYVALEGALWRTLKLLLLKPGRLTREYLDGRRRRYVLPLRLYLTASFLFFLVVKLTPSASPDHTVLVDVTGKRLGTVAELQANAASASHLPKMAMSRPYDCGAAGEPACSFAQARVNQAAARFSEHPQELVSHMWAHMIGYAPYLVFLLLPVFAGIVMLAYRNRRMTYGEHVVFSLHVHAFWFVALLLIWVLPESIAGLVQLLIPLYGTWAMHTAYGGRWGAAIVRASFVSVLYTAVLLAVSVAFSVVLFELG